MRVICDIETERLDKPEHIWLICCKDIDTKQDYTFRRPSDDQEVRRAFLDFSRSVSHWVGHNFIGFDRRVLLDHFAGSGLDCVLDRCSDTLVVSRLCDFSRPGHSLDDWGAHLGYPKESFSDFSGYSLGLEKRCLQDININYYVYQELLPYFLSPKWAEAIQLEQWLADCCVSLHDNGFYFDVDKARKLWDTVSEELAELTPELQNAFPARTRRIKEIIPRATASGTLHRGDFRWVTDGDLTGFSVGAAFSRFEWVPFNPGSPKQVVERLNEAGWQPIEKTKGHREFLHEQRQRQRAFKKETPAEAARADHYLRYGWSISEDNIETLPASAPVAAHKLAVWLGLASRQRKLKEWLDAYNPETHRIHGRFHGIGAWTQRMSHSDPNQGNIARPFSPPRDRSPTPVERLAIKYNGEFRTLFCVPKDRYLIGVDAEGIQLRVLAHYLDDPRFTEAVVSGDPHKLNWEALGEACQSRDDAKTFIYAWLLGAGDEKVGQILKCSTAQARIANANFIEFYPGLAKLKKEVIPIDAHRGYFRGFDGRFVRIWGADEATRRHLCLGGYLQNGETIVMKTACRIWHRQLAEEGLWFKFIDFVHDEWQTEVDRDMDTALKIANIQANSIKLAGEKLGLRCPMAGSIKNKSKELAIGDNWLQTH